MKATIIVFLWIVGALCLFIIAFLTYDLIVRAQDRKARKKEAAVADDPTPAEPSTDEDKPSADGEKTEPARPSSGRRKPNKKTERWTDRHKHRRKK